MNDRGECLGPGYVKGLGAVVIYASLQPGTLIVLDRRDEWRTLPRGRVQFRRRKNNGTKKEYR